MRNRAGVFRIDVYIAMLQSRPQDAGATQFALVHGSDARLVGADARDLAENH